MTSTVAECLKIAAGILADVSDSARLDAEVFLSEVLGRDRTFIYTYDEYRLSQAEQDIFMHYVQRRSQGEPVAYIIGKREFWSLMLNVGPETLIPRPDTETLVSRALELCTLPVAHVLDLGTGTGAIALALATEHPQWLVDAVDSIEDVVLLAERNRDALGIDNVTVYRSDWFGNVENRHFDIIVSNPPYIDAGDINLAVGDVVFEPKTALVAAEHGYSDLFHIIDSAPPYLKPEGWLVVEHGFEQGELVRQRFRENAYTDIHTVKDLSGSDRVTAGRYA